MALAANYLTTVQNPIDLMFDLADALTMTTNISSSISEEEEEEEIKDGEDKETNRELTVSNLPTVDTQSICMVCMEEAISGGGKQVPCGHVFHATCIAKWISLSNSCPLCRSSCSISGTTN